MIERYLNSYQVTPVIDYPSSGVVVMDTTYFGRGFRVGIFRDSNRKINLLWLYVTHETLDTYKHGIDQIIAKGCSVTGIVCDGKKGLFSAFSGIPVQMCQFHQKQIITRYITRNPKLPAGVELKAIVETLSYTCEEAFSMLVESWQLKWDDFLKEKTYFNTGKWFYTHKQLRSAIRGLRSKIPNLFTYQRHRDRMIPSTTNP